MQLTMAGTCHFLQYGPCHFWQKDSSYASLQQMVALLLDSVMVFLWECPITKTFLKGPNNNPKPINLLKKYFYGTNL